MLKIEIDETHTVSALLDVPKKAKACYVLAHGAGAGMQHPFMAAVAAGLLEREIATFRYQFPYMEQGSKSPDRPPLAYATVRAAIAAATHHVPSLPLFAGGKSFGGRMTSQAQAEEPLVGVRGPWRLLKPRTIPFMFQSNQEKMTRKFLPWFSIRLRLGLQPNSRHEF
jgi:hypothetical protein